jgi:hypothetical protein
MIITNYDMSKKGRVFPCSFGWQAEIYMDFIEPETCTLWDKVYEAAKFKTEIEAETWTRGMVLSQPDKTIHHLVTDTFRFRAIAEELVNDLALLPESADYITETLLKRL